MNIKEIKANYLLSGDVMLTVVVHKAHNKAVEKILADIGTKCQEWILTIEKRKKKRSLDSNAYGWLLIGKIADVLRASKEDVYLNMLKQYGQSTVVSIASEIDIKGFIKYYEDFGKGEVKGKEFTHYKVYKGSSEFDSKEMAILIDGIVSEAKELDIETETPEEIERMKSMWNKEE